MYGLKALQKTADLSYTNEVPTSVYNPSGMYGLKAMGKYVPDYPTPPKPRVNLGFRRASLTSQEKKMVKLAPLTVA